MLLLCTCWVLSVYKLLCLKNCNIHILPEHTLLPALYEAHGKMYRFSLYFYMNIAVLMHLNYHLDILVISNFWLLSNVAVYSCYFLENLKEFFSQFTPRGTGATSQACVASTWWGYAPLFWSRFTTWHYLQLWWELLFTLSQALGIDRPSFSPICLISIGISEGFCFPLNMSTFCFVDWHWCFLSCSLTIQGVTSFSFGCFFLLLICSNSI